MGKGWLHALHLQVGRCFAEKLPAANRGFTTKNPGSAWRLQHHGTRVFACFSMFGFASLRTF